MMKMMRTWFRRAIEWLGFCPECWLYAPDDVAVGGCCADCYWEAVSEVQPPARRITSAKVL